jgi:hypothetical protein
MHYTVANQQNRGGQNMSFVGILTIDGETLLVTG